MINIKYTSNGLLQFNNDARFRGITGIGQSVVVIDTGIDLNHPGFGDDENKDGISDRIVRKDLDFTRQNDRTVQDSGHHGTAVAGIAASVAPGTKIIPIQVSLASNIGQALNWVMANEDKYNITAVNLSLSTFGCEKEPSKIQPGKFPPMLYNEFKALNAAGISATVAAGNYYQNYKEVGVQHLASFESNLAVMNVKSDGITQGTSLKETSQRRSDALGAPGTGIEVFKVDGLTTRGSGTSFASPFMAGCLQLLQGVSEKYLHRELSPYELKNITRSTGDLIAGSEYKQINVFKAAEAIWKMGTSVKLATANDDYFTREPLQANLATCTNSGDNSFI